MKVFASKNLVTLGVSPVVPWEYQATQKISAQTRVDKEARQEWYQNIDTDHCFYTAIEAHANTQRVSKENPPRLLHGFVADYDVALPGDRISELVKALEIPPTYLEKSLGGNFRLVWLLESPIPVESRDFCTYVLQQAHDWLKLETLPGLDRPAFEETSRLYCNGCEWQKIGEPISEKSSQAFFVRCGQEFRFEAGDDTQVPLDVVESALRAKYPKFDWPNGFDLESQGPTFWIPESVSPQSAIVKPGGIFTFSAHAQKPFYSWSDLLGSGFVQKFQEDAIAAATKDIYWDSKSFWRLFDGVYRSLSMPELSNYFTVTCKLSTKKGKSGVSPFDAALNHIYTYQRIGGAAPFVFRRPGIVVFQGEKKLNTYTGRVIEPAAGSYTWTDAPFSWKLLSTILNPVSQLDHFLAWFQYFYLSALNFEPMPGQNIFLLGGVEVGKTLLGRAYVGDSTGGYADCRDFIVEGSAFNSHLLKVGVWSLDDDTPSDSITAQARLHAMIKKTAANQQFLCNAKFEHATMTEWMGRIICTTNLDYVSSRIVGSLDNSSADKTNLYRCREKSAFVFPSRLEIRKILSEELPKVLKILTVWKAPDTLERHSRYGYRSYQEPSLLSQTHQNSPTATFKEVLIEFLGTWFNNNSKEKYWEGTVSSLLQTIEAMNCGSSVFRSMRLEQASRYLEMLQREGLYRVEIHPGKHNTRLWRFYRDDA